MSEVRKQLSKAMKAAGLKKLRWFCQMCKKQCSDENSFQCHQMSESHIRQMSLFRDNSATFMDEFSKEFESAFLEVLRRRGRKRTKANTIYQEMIADRQHVHMNSTMWTTLGTFVQYLGKKGLAEVDLTEKGWYVKHVDREAIERRRRIEEQARAERSLEERTDKFIDALVAKHGNGVASNGDDDEAARKSKRDFDKTQGEEIKVVLKTKNKLVSNNTQADALKKRKVFVMDDEEDKKNKQSKQSKKTKHDSRGHDGQARTWVVPGLIVKHKKKKKTVVRVHHDGSIELDDGTRAKHDRKLQTVLPGIGKPVMILANRNDKSRSTPARKGIMLGINQERFTATVKVGGTQREYDYDDICKFKSFL